MESTVTSGPVNFVVHFSHMATVPHAVYVERLGHHHAVDDDLRADTLCKLTTTRHVDVPQRCHTALDDDDATGIYHDSGEPVEQLLGVAVVRALDLLSDDVPSPAGSTPLVKAARISERRRHR